MSRTGGRAPHEQNRQMPLPQDLVGLFQRAVLALPGLPLLCQPGRDTGAITAIDFGLFTHAFSVWAALPIFADIDRIAEHRLSCCPGLSKTMQTARSRTSGEYLLVVSLMMLHPTQELQPPANPTRFGPFHKMRRKPDPR